MFSILRNSNLLVRGAISSREFPLYIIGSQWASMSQRVELRSYSQFQAPISHNNDFPQSPISSPLSTHFSTILSQVNTSKKLPSFRYRAPLDLLQKCLNTIDRPSHYTQKWFADPTGTLVDDMVVESIWPASYFKNVENALNIPTLQHGLGKVIGSGEAHVIQNLSDQNLNYFDPFLKDISQPESLDYKKMSPFKPPSQDKFLHNLTRYSDTQFAASTSSLTSSLSAFYLLLSNYKAPYANLLPSFYHSKKFTHFTGTILDKPRFLVMRPQNDFSIPGMKLDPLIMPNRNRIYAIDSDSMPFVPVNLILTKLGHSLERALTYNPQEFNERFVRNTIITENWEAETDLAYHYTKFGDFLVRSQLDCYDPSLREGRGGIFDLKTRATAPIRFNMKVYDKYIERDQISNFVGEENSFEKEFHDMVRNAFIKYSYQAFLGRMDGMFIAYHNTSQMYGFEYLPLEELNTYVFGSDFMARKGLLYSMQLFTQICKTVAQRFPDTPTRLVIRPFRNREKRTCEVIVYVHELGNDQGWKDVQDSDIEIETFFESENPFNIPNDVYAFRVGTHVKRNGRPVHHDLVYREIDDLEVEYFIEELSNRENSLSNDVIRMMKLEAIAGAPGEAAFELSRRLREADLEAQRRDKPAMDM